MEGFEPVWLYDAGVFLGPQNDASFEGSGFLGLVKLLNLLIPQKFEGWAAQSEFRQQNTERICLLHGPLGTLLNLWEVRPMIFMSQGVIWRRKRLRQVKKKQSMDFTGSCKGW